MKKINLSTTTAWVISRIKSGDPQLAIFLLLSLTMWMNGWLDGCMGGGMEMTPWKSHFDHLYMFPSVISPQTLTFRVKLAEAIGPLCIHL